MAEQGFRVMYCLRLWGILVAVLGVALTARGDEFTARNLPSPNAVLLVEMRSPVALAENPFLVELWNVLRQSRGIRQALESDDAAKLRDVAEFAAKSLGTTPREAIDKLTAGGVMLAIEPGVLEAEPHILVVVTAQEAGSLRTFMSAVERELKIDANGGKRSNGAADQAGEAAIRQVGNGSYAVTGRQLIVSNHADSLKRAVQRRDNAARNPSAEIPDNLRWSENSTPRPDVIVTANLSFLRKNPLLERGRKGTIDDIAPTFLFGGYLNLIRRSEFATAGLFLNSRSAELKLRVGAGGANEEFPGFFASEKEEAAPLFSPPETLYSSSWHRDYQQLWRNRRNVLDPAAVQKLDEIDEGLRSLPTQIGLSELAAWLGPQFRFVLTRQREQVYSPRVEQRLPAAALVISVRDPQAVQDRLLAPLDGLILFGLGPQIEGFQKTDYRNAKLTTFQFSKLAVADDPHRAALRHLNPAYTLTRGQLIVGSTAEVVRDVIDALDRTGTAISSSTNASRTTDRQSISAQTIQAFLADFHEQIIRDVVHKQNISPDEALADFKVIEDLISRFQTVETRSTIDDDLFDIVITLGARSTE